MYANLVKAPRGRHRRTYPDDFKTQVVAACLQPGVSMAAVALANGLNANLLRRWVKEVRGGGMPAPTAGGKDAPAGPAPPTLVPVTVALPEEVPSGEIKIEIHRAQAVFQISWPAAESASCAQWLREVLR